MSNQRLWAKIIGIVLLLVGVLGFFMGSGNYNLLSIFGVNMMHSVVHLVTGAIFAWAGFSKSAPVKKVNKWLGVIYIIVGIVGFFGVLSFLNVNMADNWLHLVVGVVSALIGWTSR